MANSGGAQGFAVRKNGRSRKAKEACGRSETGNRGYNQPGSSPEVTTTSKKKGPPDDVTRNDQERRKDREVGWSLPRSRRLSRFAGAPWCRAVTNDYDCALLLVSGVAQLLLVFRAGSTGQGLMLALFAVLSLVAGGYMMSQPVAALATLTLFLAAYFVAGGVVQTLGALGARPEPGWGWLLFGGVVSLVLGVMIWRQFPLSGIWAVGTLVGIQLLLSGWTLIAVGGLAGDAADAVEREARG